MLRALALLVQAGVVVAGLAVSPAVLGDLVARRELPSARITRARIGDRLESLRRRIDELGAEAEELHFRVEKVSLAYGLSDGLSPVPTVEVSPSSFPESAYRALIQRTAWDATRVRLALSMLDEELAEISRLELEHPDRVRTTPALSPLQEPFVLVSRFGLRSSIFSTTQEFHAGIDLSAPSGTPVLAPADGRVVFSGSFRLSRRNDWWRLGKTLVIRHDDGLLTVYGHCDKLRVARGTRVERGQEIATVGETGVTEMPKLHYAVWRELALDMPEPVDPRLYMLDRRWEDEAELLASAGAKPESWRWEPLPRSLR